MAPRKRKRKPLRFKQICFKLTVGQKAALDRYCRMHNITTLRFIRTMVMSQVERYRPESHPASMVTENQLGLFDDVI